MKVSLSILTADFSNFEKSVGNVMKESDYIHLDVMDGEFVPNISIGPAFVKSIRKLTDKPFDTHLMIRHPNNYIKEFVEAGSQYITFHIEADCNAKEVIDIIHSYGIKAGISIKPKTSVKVIEELLPYLDMVLIMSVEPGFGGQKFMPVAIDKAKELKELKDKYGYNYLINVDGGINDKTLPLVKDYLDLAVSGSFVCNAEDQIKNLNILKNM